MFRDDLHAAIQHEIIDLGLQHEQTLRQNTITPNRYFNIVYELHFYQTFNHAYSRDINARESAHNTGQLETLQLF